MDHETLCAALHEFREWAWAEAKSANEPADAELRKELWQAGDAADDMAILIERLTMKPASDGE